MTAEPPKGTAEMPRPAAIAHRYTGTVAPAAAGGFVFVILRIFAVSGYDWDTAFAVSTTLGLSDGLALLFGSLMAGHLLVTYLMILILPLLLATYIWSPLGRRPVVLLATTLALVTLAALTLSFGIWWLPVAVAGVFGLFALIRRLSPTNPVRRAFAKSMASVGWVSGVCLLLVAAFVQTPWAPQEQIETTDGPLTAYVLSVDSGYLNLLTQDHEFVIVNSGDVISRK